jgi:hypothetical protein
MDIFFLQISFKLEGKDIELGEKYTCVYTRNGIVKLQISSFSPADVGTYECFAKNDYGEMNQPVIAIMAQYPGKKLFYPTLPHPCQVNSCL